MNFKPDQYFDLKDFKYPDIFKGINSTWEVLPKLSDYILKTLKNLSAKHHIQGRVHPSAVIEDHVFIARTAIVHSAAYIQGPAIIDDNAIIGHSAFVRSGSIIGQDSEIGHCSEVKNSILIKRTWASHFAYIGDSILGTNIELGAGAKLANFRLDESKITIKCQNTKINTNLHKFGSIIGDYSSIGCNSVLNPGTILGKKSQVYPVTSVLGVHPAQSKIK